MTDPTRPRLSTSYVHGASDTPLLGTTIAGALDEAARRWPDAEALVVCAQNVRWTWRELAARVDEVAAGFVALGLAPGDRLGILSPNRSEWAVTQFAASKAGLVLVNLNPAYRVVELEYALSKVGCRALVTATAFKSSDYVAMLRYMAPELDTCAPGQLHSVRLPELRVVIALGDLRVPGTVPFADLPGLASPAHRAEVQRRAAAAQFDDPANIQFTSGTTGSPKGATLTHHNILNNGFFVGEAMRFGPEDRVCIPVPLYHCFGMVMGNLACVTHGSAMVYPNEGFDARATLEAIQAERCTALYGVPTMFIAELQHPEFRRFDLTSLRTGIMAGSPCPIEIMKRAITDMHMTGVTICYGMTETSPVSFQSSLDDPIERRVSTVGRVHPHVEVKIVDDMGRVVPPGAVGELCTRGYSVMPGYWADPAKTADVIDAHGWMRTGDLATLDEEGYCNIVGRLKDMVIRGGENVYPREIEEFLFTHPKVGDVQVIGVPDEKYGEELCACVVLKPGVESLTAEEIRAFCEGRIAYFKIPRYVRVIDDFPMTVTGKIQKFALRDLVSDALGLRSAPSA